MSPTELYSALLKAGGVSEVEEALGIFEAEHVVRWIPVGYPARENNRGTIEASADSGRSIVERLTNGIDAVLEEEHTKHSGVPNCQSPKEAATAWLGVPVGGLSEMTPGQRRAIAHRVSVKVSPGESKSSRIVEVRDLGIGLTAEQMPKTILSLNETNKMTKHYLAGAYGQGGSSTFAASKYSLIACRFSSEAVGFTIVRYEDLPPDLFKIGRYVYLTIDTEVLQAELTQDEFPSGTLVRHFGYDLSNYAGSLGPGSVYGLLNQILFDPVMPVWLDHEVYGYRRVIKGSRNALNGAVDEGDAERRGPSLSHNVRMFYTTLGEFGQVGIEYWVLEPPTATNKRPSAAFVNPNKPIILTLNGQNQAEMSHLLVRKNAELTHLTQRLICHIDCNSLTPTAKRELFVSNREEARRGVVYDLIHEEVVKVLRSDDELTRLNNEAKEMGRREQDKTAIEQTRREVARLLRLQGMDIGPGFGATVPGTNAGATPRQQRKAPRHRTPPKPIEIHEPPTYVRVLWDEDEAITFYPQQRRYIRIETDAQSKYHNPSAPESSKINIIANGESIGYRGSTPLEGGRMRAIFEGASSAKIHDTGTVRVELSRAGLPMLSDERSTQIVEKPQVRQSEQRVTVPLFEVNAVEGPDDPLWTQLGWGDNVSTIASSADMLNGVLNIYYSKAYPKFADQLAVYEQRDTSLAESFTARYGIWLAVHSLILYQDQEDAAAAGQQSDTELEQMEIREQEERCRIAALAALFAAREVQSATPTFDAE